MLLDASTITNIRPMVQVPGTSIVVEHQPHPELDSSHIYC